jgi:predicted Holliday junction resolvase-like endonuclease
VFTDIKTGKARLSAGQREIRKAVEEKKVEWDVYARGGER